ncbi:hypothetical protein K493DRAFT_306862 [Basidiobolus meristosporus CBS 931.73]|uniref:Late embryogenesis abundant protein LEA-2 subgroup domain-containing protein n=1 Tax=Basidiobolus meristosporus CBS 931.73 TaxID=1314790 RepID=A0A1Y1XPG5_9FUNG|nr:hypothetical protein K493DRAFT_306862 [Basidiobolus meristosporus CBS 931.73]|eukprot:ORX87639.1 hypothetical protein K493DRAFT_306862 [Basidiobolus meristosporus CBS 931.73]
MSQYPTYNHDRPSHANKEIKYVRQGHPLNVQQPDPRGPRGYSSNGSLRTINRYPPSAQIQTPYPPPQRAPQYKQSVYTRSVYSAAPGYPVKQGSCPPLHSFAQSPAEEYEATSNTMRKTAPHGIANKNPGTLGTESQAFAEGTEPRPLSAPTPENPPEDEVLNLMNYKKNELEVMEDLEKPAKKGRGVWPCCCCPGCCSRKVCVITTFLTCMIIGVVIWLLYPKVPSSSIETIQLSGSPQVNNEQLPYFFNATLIIRVSMNNYNLIPITLSKLEAVGYDSNTNSEIGKGIAEHVSLPGQRVTSFEFPYVLTYFFGNVSDPTWIHLARSCVPTLVNFPDRSAMAVRFMASMWFPILSWTGWVPKVTYQGNFVCPEP